MARAIWNGEVIAESDATIVVEGNHYFPPELVKHEYLRESATHTVCNWKGVADYYDVVVNGAVNRDAAWYYPSLKKPPAASPDILPSGVASGSKRSPAAQRSRQRPNR